MEEKLIGNDKLEKNFNIFKRYLSQLSDEIEEDFVNNEEFDRKKRKHSWYQLLKNIRFLNSRLDIIYAKIINMKNEAPYWEKK